MRIKSHESPRRRGRNDISKKSVARLRQLKKAAKRRHKKYLSKSSDNPENRNG
ncbi:hypothetical protein AHIS1_p039 [Acaryochloris phage A-HIS1]|nr:hypothetical protein AHIS1_p039 [Acaryochloris phage A-HIS1]